MVFKVDEHILKDVRNCMDNFSCLFGRNDCLCGVAKSVDKVLFVVPSKMTFCNYKMNYGQAKVCFCPVRKELYSRYNV